MYIQVYVSFCTLNLKHLKKKVCLTYFDQRLGNGTSRLNSRNLTVGQARTRRREKLVKSEKETTKLSALWPVLCILIKSSDMKENEWKITLFFVDVMIEKTVLSVKKAKEWKKKIIIEDWCFCYNGLQCFSTLHRLWLQHVLPVGVSGIISMLNLCDINEKFPNSNTWVHLSSIWLVFFFSQSSLLSPLILLACRCNMEQKFDLFSQNCFNFVEMINALSFYRS